MHCMRLFHFIHFHIAPPPSHVFQLPPRIDAVVSGLDRIKCWDYDGGGERGGWIAISGRVGGGRRCVALPCMEAAGIVNQISFSLPKGSSVRGRKRERERERERDSASGLEEYYDETGESDVATRGGIVYEAQNCRRCTAFMHCPVVQFSTLKSRPRPTPLQPSESASLSPALDPPFSSHVRIKPHNNGENNRLPAAALPPPPPSPAPSGSPFLLPPLFFRFQPRALLRSAMAALFLYPSLISFSHFMILLFISA